VAPLLALWATTIARIVIKGLQGLYKLGLFEGGRFAAFKEL